MDSNQLADKQQIQEVMLNYARGVDERDKQRYTNCFSNDVEIVNFGSQTIIGLSSWVNYVWTALEKYTATQHLLSPAQIELTKDTAVVRSNVQATHFLANQEQPAILWASYLSHMTKIKGDWKISRHELRVKGTNSQTV